MPLAVIWYRDVTNDVMSLFGRSDKKVMEMAGNIYQTTLDILNKSHDENISTSLAANRIAEKRIKEESLKSK